MWGSLETKKIKKDADSFGILRNRNLEKFDYLNKFYNQVEDTNLKEKNNKKKIFK